MNDRYPTIEQQYHKEEAEVAERRERIALLVKNVVDILMPQAGDGHKQLAEQAMQELVDAAIAISREGNTTDELTVFGRTY